MTVSTTTTKVIYNGDGATTAFPTTFEFFDAADIEVIERVISTGAETVKLLTTDYTVSGGNGSTGTVTAVTAPPATVQWVLRRKTPLTQAIDYIANDAFPAETHEKGLDLAVMRAQERKEELGRAPKFPITDPASSIGDIPNSVDRAGNFFGFDANGKPIASAGSVDQVATTAFTKTLLDDADAATALATLTALGQGKYALSIPASYMRPRVSNGCAALTDVETTADRPDMQVLDYDSVAEEHAQFTIIMPKAWNEGTLTVRTHHTHAGGQTAGLDGVTWAVKAVAISADDTIDVAFGTAVNVTVDKATLETEMVSAESAALTVGGTPAASDRVVFDVGRIVTDAGDDLNINARLLGVEVFLTINAVDDA